MQNLKNERIWVCWNKKEVDGRVTKMPISAQGTATGTDDAHSDTWVVYEEAYKAAQDREYSGTGFVVPQGYFFLDIDHKDLNDPFVKKMLERFNSYAEKSVSKEGLHIYGKCDLAKLPTTTTDKGKLKLDDKYYTKNPNNGVELYIGGLTNRYAVFTGDAVVNESLKDCTNAILVTLDKDMLKEKRDFIAEKAEKKKRDQERRIARTIEALRNQKNGEKFIRLFDEGDVTGYGSHSEADMALCQMIAFRVGVEFELIDAIFRKSALYREKWERDDYRNQTIARGINSCHGTFHKSTKPMPDFIRVKDNTCELYVLAPALARHVRQNLKYIFVRDNGKQGILKYVYEDGVYKLYADDMFKGLIRKIIAEYDEDLVRMHQVNETYNNLITDIDYKSQDELNAVETVINFKNGLLFINKDELRLMPHSPDIYSTIQIPCNYTGKEEPTPVFDKYMDELTGGDKEIQQLLLEFIGVCISNIKGYRMKKSLFMVGDGDTGKSQLKSLVERLLGKGNFIGIDLSEIEARFGTGAIYGTRLAGSSDMSFMTVDELKTFKKITGGDSLFAEFKGQQAFEYTYNGLLWFCMNKLPKFGGDDGKWVYNRIMVVNCNNVIPKEKQDRFLLEKMYKEREGIIYKAVKALRRVIKNSFCFTEPACVSLARTNYRSENNTVIAFFEECMRERPDGRVHDKCTTGRTYKVYKAWCLDNNNGYAKTAKEFRETLATHLNTSFSEMTKRINGNTYYKDYTLTNEVKEEYQKVYGYDSIRPPYQEAS